MRYLIAFAAVVCLAGNAFAATPIRGIAVKGGKNPPPSQITAEPNSGSSTQPDQTAPQPQENAKLIPGIGIVVKKNCPNCNSSERAANPDATTPGACDHAINTKGTSGNRVDPNGTSGCPNPKDVLRTRTKSNQANE